LAPLVDLALESGDLGLEEEDAELVEALSVLDSGRKSLCDLNRIACRALAVSEDVESCSWRDREGFLLMPDRGFAEDFPSDIERELGSKGDRIVVRRWGERKFVGLTGRGLVRCVRHRIASRSWEDAFPFFRPSLLCSRG